MKQIRTLVTVLAVAFTVSSCGAAGMTASSAPQNAPAASQSTSASAASGAASSHAGGLAGAGSDAVQNPVGREETTKLQMEVEGFSEKVPATLYVGEEYSLYIPDEEWTFHAASTTNQIAGDYWVSKNNLSVYFAISRGYAVDTLEEAEKNLLGESYLQSDDNDLLFTRSVDGTVEVIRLAQNGADGTVWYLECQYPAEAEEGFGVRIPTILDTFEFR